MRETVRSLRIYLIFTGVLGVLYGIEGVARVDGHPLATVLLLVVLALSAGILYIGVRLRQLLIDSPTTINAVLYANVGFSFLGLVLGIIARDHEQALFQSFGVLIFLYIIFNIRRLAAETLRAATSPGV